MDQTAIVAFFQEVADASPIPIIIYNFPSIVNGLNLSPETLQLLGRHSNIAAVKLTCGGIAKVAAVAATAPPESFAALAGQGDWLLPALSVGGVGCIAGASNLFPQVSFWSMADPRRDSAPVRQGRHCGGGGAAAQDEPGRAGVRAGRAKWDQMARGQQSWIPGRERALPQANTAVCGCEEDG
ncbi:dihydrodipicolinate synthetase family domain-containing protein [Purpureocillium lilacinum]|uniref:Dihydrodipicolinate synthetase family domain-containing protein n=1 Tax=Purpureocillium lilacinum TaxID=33203 RepID=A0A179GFT5_PURLI|nr:dihydrodipicolinate synthetase family domain-containing protein [Purpureocillium lilacinum]